MRAPGRDDPRTQDEDEHKRLYHRRPEDPLIPEVDVTENPVVARLYGPNGEVLVEQRERPPFGFQVP